MSVNNVATELLNTLNKIESNEARYEVLQSYLENLTYWILKGREAIEQLGIRRGLGKSPSYDLRVFLPLVHAGKLLEHH